MLKIPFEGDLHTPCSHKAGPMEKTETESGNGNGKRKRKRKTETENGNGKGKRKIGNEMEALARGLV